jgi:hypothetical protein
MTQTSRERAPASMEADETSVRALATNLLAERFVGTIQLQLREVVSDYAGAANTVLRYDFVADDEAHPQTVIVKWARRFPELVAREAAGLAFLNTYVPLNTMAPRCYGLDRTAGLLVLEDLPITEAQRLGQILFTADHQAAREGLVSLMRTLGAMHAIGYREHAHYKQLCEQYQVFGQGHHPVANLLTDLGDLLPLLSHYGVMSPPALARDLRTVSAALLPSSSLLTFTHGTATPANTFITPTGVRLIDLEASGYRDALLDGAFPRIRSLFSIWARTLPLAEQHLMEQAYREEFAAGCPAMSDDAHYHPALAAACAAWLAALCARIPLVVEQDRPWGQATWRQRIIAGLEQFVLIADETRQLPALATAAQQLATQLCKQWPPEDCRLPLYPAFEPVGGRDEPQH